jgi:hypothetical protein
LDDSPDCRLKLSADWLKYLFVNNRANAYYDRAAKRTTIKLCGPTGNLTPKDDASTEDESEEEVDLTQILAGQ